MRFRVVQTYRRGVPVARRELFSAVGIVGELLTVEITDDAHKGHVQVAKLQDDASGKPSIELIPTLYQPVLRTLAVQGLLLTGHERIPRTRAGHCRIRTGMVAALALDAPPLDQIGSISCVPRSRRKQ